MDRKKTVRVELGLTQFQASTEGLRTYLLRMWETAVNGFRQQMPRSSAGLTKTHFTLFFTTRI